MKGRKQDGVNAKKYGCQRKEKINVKVIWSSRNYNKVTKNEISGATNCSSDDSLAKIPHNCDLPPPSKMSKYTKRNINRLRLESKIKSEDTKLKLKEKNMDKKVQELQEKSAKYVSIATKIMENKIRTKMNEIEEKKQKAILNVQLMHKEDVTKSKRQNKYLKKKHEDLASKMESKDL